MNNIFKTGITIPKVVKKLDLKNYHDELKGQCIFVWVNLTREMHIRYTDIQTQLHAWSNVGQQILIELDKTVKEAQTEKKSEKEIKKIRVKFGKQFDAHAKDIESINDEMYAWYSEVWSQHSNEVHHCTPAEVRTLADSSNEQDDGSFWGWITTQTQGMILAHRNQHLKK